MTGSGGRSSIRGICDRSRRRGVLDTPLSRGITPLAEQRALHRVRDTMFSADGYRFAKWQGKPNLAIP
jgi:hypothetical protein